MFYFRKSMFQREGMAPLVTRKDLMIAASMAKTLKESLGRQTIYKEKKLSNATTEPAKTLEKLVPPTRRELEGPERKKKKAEKTSDEENRQDPPTSTQTPNKRYSLVKTSIRNSPTFPPTNPLTPVLDNRRFTPDPPNSHTMVARTFDLEAVDLFNHRHCTIGLGLDQLHIDTNISDMVLAGDQGKEEPGDPVHSVGRSTFNYKCEWD